MRRFETRSGFVEVGDGGERLEEEEDGEEEDEWRKRGSHDHFCFFWSLFGNQTDFKERAILHD